MALKDATMVTICGGGNGAHTLAGIASMKEHLSVTVLDIYEDEPERWNKALQEHGFTVNLPKGDQIVQLPGRVKFTITRDVKEAIASANVVIIVCPAFAHEIYLNLIATHLSDSTLVVGMPGQPGFEYQCLHYLRKHDRKCSVMGLETLPWACRIGKYGQSVSVLGVKDEVESSVISQGADVRDPMSIVQNIIGTLPALKKVNSALEIILVSKSVIHPPILYVKWKDWDGTETHEKPLFYQGVDQRAAEYLNLANNELIEIAEKVKLKYSLCKDIRIGTIHEWLVEHYGDQITDRSTLLTTLQTNKAYSGLVHPMNESAPGKYVPDFSHRYLTEDVPYGILVHRAIAEMINVNTPVLDEIITWAQDMLGVDYLVDGRVNVKLAALTRVPQSYGLHSVQDIVNFCKSV